MRKSKRKKGSFVSFLIKYYIGFTLAVAFIIMTVFYAYILVEEGLLEIPKVDKLIRQEELLKDEKYHRIKTSRLLGESGYFEILDEQGNIIYSSNSGYNNIYTLSELSCIQSYYTSIDYQSAENVNTQGKKRYVISEVSYNNGEEARQFALLDENFKVLDCSVKWPYKTLTEREYYYLTGRELNGYSIFKYEYTTNRDEKNTLIVHTQGFNIAAYEKFTAVSALFIPVFGFFYIILTGIFILWLSQKVKKPLTILNRAMLDFTDGIRDIPVEYNGPKEFVQICDSFNEMSSRLKESEAAKQRLDDDRKKMMADISHDLKTPITVIQGYSKALAEGLIGDDKKDKYLNTIYTKASGLTELINTFFEYSKLEHLDFTMNKEETNICEFCREYIASKYEEIEIAGFQIELSIPESAVCCLIDPIQFKRVLENIVVNALKHNKTGTTLFFTVLEDEKQVILTLGDNGAGIPREIANTVFKPFTVGDESRNNKQGSGLGLAIVKKIVEAHQGTITLVIPPSQMMSTEFKIVLPH